MNSYFTRYSDKAVSDCPVACDGRLSVGRCIRTAGVTSGLNKVFQKMLQASQTQETVMILGETGTGKELAARCLHRMGQHPERPFIPVDCCTLASSLVESELFGYVRGAFTGAATNKIGLFEAAQGGTLFLDEIGEMPLDMQAKLLRAIQEREIRPVGGTGWVEFTARIVVAASQDLELAMQQGTFRKDLYFRLNVLTITLPPLRERKQDILPLVNYFLSELCGPKGKQMELSAEALDCLEAYDWPGNVRELQNCIRRAVAWGSGPVICPEDLPPNIPKPTPRLSDFFAGEHQISLRKLEQQAILRAIADANGDKQLAARILGIGKTTLYRKLKEYAVASF